MRIGCVALLLIVASTGLPKAQRDVKDHHLSLVDQWIRKNYEATERYRSGDLSGALALLGTMTKEEQERAVNGIRTQIDRIAAGWPPRKEDVVSWTLRLLQSLAALHMEAAIVARQSKTRNAHEIAGDHMAIAATAFGAAAALSGGPDDFAVRWILAIGLERLAEGEFVEAYDILMPHCGEKQSYAKLLVACGTIHETFASFPADQLEALADKRYKQPIAGHAGTLGRSMRELFHARGERNYQLAAARKYFERALAADASSTEARLRLAQVRIQQKQEGPAAEHLEELIARPALNSREQYLARLFLARIRDREKRYDAAAALLAEAGEHQTSLIARAYHAQRRGDARDAAALAERASRLGTDDPWWSYRHGQYWLHDDLIKQLREEARK